MKRHLIKAVTIVAVGIVATCLLGLRTTARTTVDSVMSDFYRDDASRAEDMLMDPLMLHADLVKRRVIDEVVTPTMPKRRYAIHFLGVARIADALPVLRTILSNEDENDHFRADALDSIYRIAKEEGLALARHHQSRGNFLGYVAKGLIDGTHKPFGRTYAQAAIGHHE